MSPEEFANEFGPEFTHQATINDSPYGPSAHYTGKPIKPGLTKRGKAAIAIGVTVIAGGVILIYQDNAAAQSAADVKAAELALKQQELRIQELKEINKANESNAKTQSTQDKARQKQIDACVATDKGLVGKQLGVTYSSVLEDCQARFGSAANTTTGTDMQAAASTSTGVSGNGGGGVNQGLLVGGVLAIGLAVAVKKSTKPTPA